jgi:phage tail tape-measure protein
MTGVRSQFRRLAGGVIGHLGHQSLMSQMMQVKVRLTSTDEVTAEGEGEDHSLKNLLMET